VSIQDIQNNSHWVEDDKGYLYMKSKTKRKDYFQVLHKLHARTLLILLLKLFVPLRGWLNINQSIQSNL
jgi:hypothetical protein